MALAPTKETIHRAIVRRRNAQRLALVLAGYRVSLVEHNGLQWSDAHDGGPCKHGHYYPQRASNGETAIMWIGDPLP